MNMKFGLTAAVRNSEGEGAGGGDADAGNDAGKEPGAGSGAGLLGLAGADAGKDKGGAGDADAGDKAAAAEGDGDGADKQADAGDGDGDKKPEAYFPEGLDEKFKGETDKETIDKLAAELANQPKAPESPDAYELKLSDEAAARLGDLADDPMLPEWRKIAHEEGLTNDAFNNIISKINTSMVEKGLLVDTQSELKALAPDATDPAAQKAAASQRVEAAIGWIKGLGTREVLANDEVIGLIEAAQTAAGVKALEKLKAVMAEKGIVTEGGDPPGGGQTGLTPEEKRLNSMFPSMAQ